MGVTGRITNRRIQMKLAFLYAGQGSQKAGMGKDFYETRPEFAEILDAVSLDFDIKDLMFHGPEEQLSQTRYTQPCMAAFAAGVTAILKKEGIAPEYVAGLSLGEYSALHAAGVFDAKTLVELVAFRGKAMEDAARGIECKMSAVMGMESAALQNICETACAQTGKYVTVSNFNCTGQYVICGEEEAVAAAELLAKEAGAKRAMPLKVSGPFHTKFMQPAGEALKQKFEEISFGEMQVPVIFNTVAKELPADKTIPELLVEQVQSSIYMEETIKLLEAKGVDTIVEIGPGKVLSGFVKRTASGIISYTVEDEESLKAALTALKGNE